MVGWCSSRELPDRRDLREGRAKRGRALLVCALLTRPRQEVLSCRDVPTRLTEKQVKEVLASGFSA